MNCFQRAVLSYFLEQFQLSIIPILVTSRREKDIHEADDFAF